VGTNKRESIAWILLFIFIVGCSSTTVIEKRPERCFLYKTGKQAYPKHDPHKKNIFSAMAWNKEYMAAGYNMLELERHHIECDAFLKEMEIPDEPF